MQCIYLDGMFGLNNGYCHDISYVGQFTFDENVVGFIGGIAGRQARGAIYDAYSCPSLAFTSGAFTDTLSVDITTDYLVNINCSKSIGEIVDNSINTHPEVEFIVRTSAAANTAYNDLIKTDVITGKVIEDVNSSNNVLTSFSAIYVTDISAKDGYIMPEVFGNMHTSAKVFKITDRSLDDELLSNCKLIVSSDELAQYTKNNATTAQITMTNAALYNTYCVVTYSYGSTTIDKMAICTTDKNTYYGVNSNVDDFVLVTDDVTQIDVQCYATLPVNESYFSAGISLSWLLNLSETNLGSAITVAQYDKKLTRLPTSSLNITLSPLFHAGGFCGEYVITDMTEKSFMSTNDEYDNMQLYNFSAYSLSNIYSLCKSVSLFTDEEIFKRQYSAYNTISDFAADMSLDTMNKSNSDLLSAFAYTSANSLQRIKFNNVNVCYDNIEQEATNTAFCSTRNKFIRYFNYTPDAMPAVIVSEPHGAGHSEGKTHEPNFGITWLDQLFFKGKAYKTGIYDATDQLDCTDAYINSPAQVSSFDMRNESYTKNESIYTWLYHEKLFDTFIETDGIDTGTAYITTQSDCVDWSPAINTPYQYVQGRVGYNKYPPKHDNIEYDKYLYGSSDEKYGYYRKVSTRYNNNMSFNISEAILRQTNTINNIHNERTKPAYTYTYSSDPITGLPVLSLTLGYTDNYIFTAEQVVASLNKAYALTSDSYYAISADNNTYTDLPTFTYNDEPLYKNSLVFGYIPGSADILSCLDQDVSRHLYCSGISADDIQYMLVVDAEKRPIFDVKLDVTAADNDGYIVDFEKIQTMTRTETGDISGLAINIVNG